MADKTTAALSALVKLLQTKMNDPELDDIDVMLNGGTDPDTGQATDAMTRKAKRSMSTTKLAADKKAGPAYAERFPNAGRLAR